MMVYVKNAEGASKMTVKVFDRRGWVATIAIAGSTTSAWILPVSLMDFGHASTVHS